MDTDDLPDSTFFHRVLRMECKTSETVDGYGKIILSLCHTPSAS
ncbi:hypothetical protein [uncultured Nitrosomonas sp.]|nr:hypothetical protein [uncultured Nitrosomonas sp.]